MELVSGKKPLELEYGESIDIVKWVCSRDSALLSVVDSRIPEVLKEEAVRVLKVAKLCTESLPNLRPTMRTVVGRYDFTRNGDCYLKLVTIYYFG